jgi:hypothetical protein
MPVDPERRARLFYDPHCGPCRFLAGAAEGVSHGRLESIPFDAPAARTVLADLAEEVRFDAAHVVSGSERRSGPEIVASLVGTTFGPRAGELFARFPTLDRPLRWLYLRLWNYRRRSACATPSGA